MNRGYSNFFWSLTAFVLFFWMYEITPATKLNEPVLDILNFAMPCFAVVTLWYLIKILYRKL